MSVRLQWHKDLFYRWVQEALIPSVCLALLASPAVVGAGSPAAWPFLLLTTGPVCLAVALRQRMQREYGAGEESIGGGWGPLAVLAACGARVLLGQVLWNSTSCYAVQCPAMPCYLLLCHANRAMPSKTLLRKACAAEQSSGATCRCRTMCTAASVELSPARLGIALPCPQAADAQAAKPSLPCRRPLLLQPHPVAQLLPAWLPLLPLHTSPTA